MAQFLAATAGVAATAATIMDIIDTGKRVNKLVRPARTRKNVLSLRRRVLKGHRLRNQKALHEAGPRRPRRGARVKKRRSQHNKLLNLAHTPMTRSNARSRRRRAPRRRGRRAGKRAKSSSRRRRKSVRGLSRLRLYPGGVPKTHIVKLRMMKQCIITSSPGKWAFIRFSPANLRDPMSQMDLTGGAVATHQQMKWTLKDGTITPRPQPYGFDHWLDTTASPLQSTYGKFSVLGCKISLIRTPLKAENTDAASYTQLYAGFNQRTWPSSTTDGSTFASTYGLIDSGEISDWINAGVCPRAQIITQAKQLGSGAGTVFTHHYSQKKYRRQLRKIGATDESWYGSHGIGPAENPQAFFMIADLGPTDDGTPVPLAFMLNMEYTVQLTGMLYGNESEA